MYDVDLNNEKHRNKHKQKKNSTNLRCPKQRTNTLRFLHTIKVV